MNLFDTIVKVGFVIAILTLLQCSSEPKDPAILALNEVITQYHDKSTLSSELLPIKQSQIPSTEQLRNSYLRSIEILGIEGANHLPKSIRIPDPALRHLASENLLDKTEMQLFLAQLNTQSQSRKLKSEMTVDFNQSYQVLDSIGYESIETFSIPILVNDKLLVCQNTTSGISQYMTVKPEQILALKVYKKSSDKKLKSWDLLTMYPLK